MVLIEVSEVFKMGQIRWTRGLLGFWGSFGSEGTEFHVFFLGGEMGIKVG